LTPVTGLGKIRSLKPPRKHSATVEENRMRVLRPGQGSAGSKALPPRAIARAAVALVIAIAGAQPAAAAPASSTVPTPDVQAIVRQLASAAASEPLASCSADSSPASPFAAFAPGGAFAPPPPPGSSLHVTCALPYTTGKPGADCNGKHLIQFQHNGTQGAKVTAELMGLDTSGNLIKSFLVKNGDTAQLSSRLSPSDARFAVANGNGNKDYTVAAPLPLLKVTVEDQGDKAVAYCSNIPWVDEIEPSGGVATADTGNQTKVLAAVPNTDRLNPHLFVDGVDLFKAGVMNPPLPPLPADSCTSDFPCQGTATVNGNPVQVTGLVVDIAKSIDSQSSNTISATLTNLACGGHYFKVTMAKAPGGPKNTAASCFVDDLTDKASSSVFAITISNPIAGQITPIVPTPVQGEVCSGTNIMEVKINGKVLLDGTNLNAQTTTPGNGTTVGDVFKYVINTTLGQTDLRADFDALTTKLDTFDAGSNRLVASAKEIKGAHAYQRLIFATGSNIKPLSIDPSATVIQQAALQAEIQSHVKQAVEAKLQTLMNPVGTTELKNAFIVGVTAEGAQRVFNNICNRVDPQTNETPGQVFKAAVEKELKKFNSAANKFTSFDFDPPCSCKVTVDVWISEIQVGDTIGCPIEFEDGRIKVSLKLPDITTKVSAYGDRSCAAGIQQTTVDAFVKVRTEDIHFDYTITENDLLGNTTTVGPNPFQLGGKVQLAADGGVEYNIVGDVCNFFVEGFVKLLTFGGVDVGPLLNPHLDISTQLDLATVLGPAKPRAIPYDEVKVEEQTTEPYHQKMSGLVTEVHITGPSNKLVSATEGAGFTAGLKGTFATTKIDLGVPSNPGIEVKEPPVPDIRAMRAQGADARASLVGLSDDSINMMFASLAGGGDMKMPNADAQGCLATGANVGSLLPPLGCDTLNLGPGLDFATAGAQGYCHAIKGDACTELTYPDPAFTSEKRGVCQGGKGGDCNLLLPDLVAWGACLVTPNLHLAANQNIMFCSKADIPRMAFPSLGAGGGVVPAELHLNDMSVALVIDRGTNGVPNNAVDAPLNTLPGCFSGLETASDCSIFTACLDINVNFSMNNIVCPDTKPGIQAAFNSIKIINRDAGVVCSGQTSPTSDDVVVKTAADDTITGPIALNAGVLAPPMCGAGLNLGVVTCDNTKVLSLESDGDPKFREFLALTCNLN